MISSQLSVVSCQLLVVSTEMAGQSYKDLLVWQKSMQFVTEIYRLTDGFPRVEQFGLCAQLRRAVVSISSNIAEGQGRNSPKEFVYHLSVAYGSLMEAETQIQIAANLSYVSQVEADKLIAQAAEVGRMLNGLSRSLAQNKELKTAN